MSCRMKEILGKFSGKRWGNGSKACGLDSADEQGR